ncbi:MAG: energy transducer TonB [Nitrososphaerales archaeon]
MNNSGRVFCRFGALSAGALAAMLCAPSWAQTAPEHSPESSTGGKTPVEVFQEPQLKPGKFHIDLVRDSDSGLQRNYGNATQPLFPEGWVILDMMVDPHGKPFEVAIVDSSGNKVLDNAVVRGLQGDIFVPGSVNGKPIASSYEYRYFSVPPGALPSGNGEFIQAIKSLTAAIQSRDRSAADAAMQKVKIESPTEDAYFGLATYQYAQVWGDQAEQLKALRRTLVWPDDENVLPKDVFAVALRARLQLELETHEYGEAITTWKRLQKLGADPGMVAKVTPIMQELDRLRLDHREVEVSGQLRGGSWFLQLFKPQFRIEVTDGHISDVKLRCQKRYLSFTFDPSLQYQVSGDSGDCTIQLEGAEGTRFKFVEF